MAGINTSVSITGVSRVTQLVRRAALIGRERAALNERLAIQALNWIQRNFQAQGGLLSNGPWPALSPNTLLGRRKQGAGAKILQDTGTLKNSFTMRVSASEAAVGTNVEYAEYHERGTDPYMIFPSPGKVLAFPHVAGRPLAKATLFPSKERRYPKGTPIMYAPFGVAHPGLKQRRMLPTREEILPFLTRAATNYLNEKIRGRR